MAPEKMSKYSPMHAKVIKVEPMPPDEAKWIRLQKITYQDPTGGQRTWEAAERQTRRKHTETDGVGVIAILSGPDMPPSLLLQKQFRPPLNKCTIEVPSGLIDEGEDIATAALRELKEETGYVATIPKSDSAPSDRSSTTASMPKSSDPLAESDPTGFIMHNDPGFCNTNTRMLFVDVDLTDPVNQNPVSELEENEYIETFTLPLKGLWDELRKLDREGFGIDARVATLAQGWEMARRWRGELD